MAESYVCKSCGHGRVTHAFYNDGTSRCWRGHTRMEKGKTVSDCKCQGFIMGDTNDVSFVSEAQTEQESLLGVVHDG